MEISLLLAKIIGIYLVVDGLVAITKQAELGEILEEFKTHRSAVLFYGLMIFIIGLVLVSIHNIWSGAAFQIALSLLGWALVLKGLLISLLPHSFFEFLISTLNKPVIYNVAGSISVILGAWLAISGFVL